MLTLLITGAASGIGAGLAKELARAGHHIIVSDLQQRDCQVVADQIRHAGGSADALALDVTSDASVASAFSSLPRPIDVLINDAGLQHVAPLEDFAMSKWDYLVQVMHAQTIASVRSRKSGTLTPIAAAGTRPKSDSTE